MAYRSLRYLKISIKYGEIVDDLVPFAVRGVRYFVCGNREEEALI